MRKYFRSLADVLASPIVAAVNALRRDKAARQDRVLQSTKLEDMIYQGLHKGDDELIALEQSCTEKLSTFSALSRDIYQSFYSLRVRKREEESLSAPSRRFNVPILKELMDGDSYPTIKAACEGRQIPAYEAAGEFISQVADNLDSLMEQAGGQKNALETLEHLEEKRDQSMERLQKLIEQMEQSGATPALETQLIKAANTAQSQSNQVEAVGRIVQENLQKHSGELTLLVKQASEAAAQTAIDVQLTLMSWGTGPDNSDPKSIAADTELVHRVQQNDTLMKVARYLGRLKELMEKRLCLRSRREVHPGAWRGSEPCAGFRICSPGPSGNHTLVSAEAPEKGPQAVPAPGAHLQGKRRHHLYAGRVQFCGEPSTLV